jgi:hypothetical protein
LTAWLDALLGRIYSTGVSIPLSKGLNFRGDQGIKAVLNATTKAVDIALDIPPIVAAIPTATTETPGKVQLVSGSELQNLSEAQHVITPASIAAILQAANQILYRAAGGLSALAVAANSFVGRAGSGVLASIAVSADSFIGRAGSAALGGQVVGADQIVANPGGVGLGGMLVPTQSLLARGAGSLAAVTLASGEVLGRAVGGDLGSLSATQLADCVASATTAQEGVVELCTAAENQVGTDATRAVTPATQRNHQSATKAWVAFTDNGAAVAIADEMNVSSVTRSTSSDFVVNFNTAFANTAYAAVSVARNSGAVRTTRHDASSGSALRVRTYDAAGSLAAVDLVQLIACGDV